MIKEPILPRRAGYRPDFRLGDTNVEVKSDVHSFRNFRATLLQLAYYIAEEPNNRGLLVLVNPRITDAALKKEWHLVKQALHPQILARLALATKRADELSTIAGTPDSALLKELTPHIAIEARVQPYRAPQSPDAVFLVLLNQWFQRAGPMTTQWLIQAVGCSYPTVANALRRLDHVIKRNSDRQIQLWGFPMEEWQRVAANRERAHPTLHYVDRSGQRRSADSLLRRASTLERDDIAVGGVIAAHHYYSDFDLRGVPRLDLTLHSPDGRADLSFVERLDPALERTSGKDDSVVLAVHVLRRQASFFESTEGTLPWADRVTTLLDLYDGRLELQAREFLNYLVESVG